MNRSPLSYPLAKDAFRGATSVAGICRSFAFRVCCAGFAAAVVLVPASRIGFAADDGWQAQVGQALGKTGANMPGGVYRVGLPRTDLKATLDGVALKPGFALGGWLAFEKTGDQGMVMGDLVLTEEEVKQYVRENLARYKSPRDVVFLDELPRNPTGKVLKRELANLG